VRFFYYSAHPPASLLTRWYSQSFLSLLAPPCQPTNELEPIDGPSTMKTQAQSSTNLLFFQHLLLTLLVLNTRTLSVLTNSNNLPEGTNATVHSVADVSSVGSAPAVEDEASASVSSAVGTTMAMILKLLESLRGSHRVT